MQWLNERSLSELFKSNQPETAITPVINPKQIKKMLKLVI